MTPSLDDAITAVGGAIDATPDPIDRLQEASEAETAVAEVIRGVRQRIATELHAQGKPWREVGKIMGGVTAQRAWQIARGE